MALRAQNVIGLYGIAAVAAFAVMHQLTLFQSDFELLLVTVDLQQRRSKQGVGDHPEIPE